MSHKKPPEHFHSPAEWEAYLEGFEDALKVEDVGEYVSFLDRIAYDVVVLRQNQHFIDAYNETRRYFVIGWNKTERQSICPNCSRPIRDDEESVSASDGVNESVRVHIECLRGASE